MVFQLIKACVEEVRILLPFKNNYSIITSIVMKGIVANENK